MALILVAEDSAIVCAAYQDMLDTMGHEVIICRDGHQAVTAFLEHEPDMVLLDVNMPEMNGIDACKEIRKIPSGIAVPIVMISSMDEEEDVLRGMNAGADDYLVKPVKSTILAAKMKNLLGTAALHKDDFDLARSKAVINNRYKVHKVIGYSIHSVVFLAYDLENDNLETALKLLKRDLSCLDFTEQYINAAKAFMAVSADSLVKPYDAGIYEGRAYTVMEYIKGGSLKSLLKTRNLTDLEAAKMGLEIIRTLLEINKNGLIHFDVKPENIMIRRGEFLLSDFGMVIQRDSATVPIGMDLWCPPEYISPEYLSGEDDITSKSDVYSLGIVLYEAVSNENPFDGQSSASSMFRQMNLDPPNLTDIDSSISDSFSHVVLMMLAKNPEARPDLDDLQKLLTNLYDLLKYTSAHKSEYIGSARRDSEKEPQDVPSERKLTNKEMQEKIAAAKSLKKLLKPKKKQLRKAGVKSQKLPTVVGLAVLLTLVIFIGIGYFIDRFTHSANKIELEVEKGPLNVVQCFKCQYRSEKRFKDIRKVKCDKCGCTVGLAFECLKCKRKFAQPLFEAGLTEEQYEVFVKTRNDCPYCQSRLTVPALTSLEIKENKK